MDGDELIECMDDPVVGLTGDGYVRSCNAAATELFDPERVVGEHVTEVFTPDADLAASYSDALAHYPDVGGVVEGGACHFDPEHRTIAAARERRDPRDDDPDVGVFVDGDLRYYHLTTPEPEDDEWELLVFRDITPVKRRERDLDFLKQVMTRILRHNLRNDLSVIGGYADAIADGVGTDHQELARVIKRKSDDLVATSEKARLIEKAIESDEQVTHDLQSVVADSLDRVRRANPDLDPTVTVSVPDVGIRAIAAFPRALTDVIENAVVYSGDGTVEITGSHHGAWVSLEVDDDGPGIPDGELETLTNRGESALVHGSGAGLWLIYTAVERSRGEISFDTEGGTTVRMHLPAAT
jgi:signal transduction histidine kinase